VLEFCDAGGLLECYFKMGIQEEFFILRDSIDQEEDQHRPSTSHSSFIFFLLSPTRRLLSFMSLWQQVRQFIPWNSGTSNPHHYGIGKVRRSQEERYQTEQRTLLYKGIVDLMIATTYPLQFF
jgi:hypothetical protein